MPDGMTVDYDGLIPNNVGLNEDARVRKALETWHPGYVEWWKTMGPVGFQDALVYLRTAVGVGAEGWARFDYVKMPEYRWGILLAPQVEGRTIPFGAHKGEPVWQEVPGEQRAMLRRLLVIQGDTEPASVEQQRHLGATAPSRVRVPSGKISKIFPSFKRLSDSLIPPNPTPPRSIEKAPTECSSQPNGAKQKSVSRAT